MVRSAAEGAPPRRGTRAEAATTQWPVENGGRREDAEERDPGVCGSWELRGPRREGPAPLEENSERSGHTVA